MFISCFTLSYISLFLKKIINFSFEEIIDLNLSPPIIFKAACFLGFETS